eukprot:GEMP01006108.1.p1 GENE.GEMP01006108.1~~GEMP01006108.1.p1  ORF type:complete len:358 (+),score=43.11 GEMP01006108.1:25-1074(+)
MYICVCIYPYLTHSSPSPPRHTTKRFSLRIMTHRRPMDSQGFVYMALHHYEKETGPSSRTTGVGAHESLANGNGHFANRPSVSSRGSAAAPPCDGQRARSDHSGAAGIGSVRSPMDSRGFVHQALCYPQKSTGQRVALDSQGTEIMEKKMAGRRMSEIRIHNTGEVRKAIEGILVRIDDSPPQARQSYVTRNSSVVFNDSSDRSSKGIRILPHQQSSIGPPIYSDPILETSLPPSKGYMMNYRGEQARASISGDQHVDSPTPDPHAPVIRSREEHYTRVLKGSLAVSDLVPTKTEARAEKRVSHRALYGNLKAHPPNVYFHTRTELAIIGMHGTATTTAWHLTLQCVSH